MLPLLLFSILTLYVLIERLIALRRATKVPQRWLDNLYTQLQVGDLVGIATLCATKPYTIAKIIQTSVTPLPSHPQDLHTSLEHAAQHAIYRLEENLPLLGTIASAAPMLGFLGTVLGMIQAFMAMAQTTQQVSPQLLSNGIYEALITTAAGLIVGIVANLSYNYLLTRIQKATHHIEQTLHQFITLVQKLPAKSDPSATTPHGAASSTQ